MVNQSRLNDADEKRDAVGRWLRVCWRLVAGRRHRSDLSRSAASARSAIERTGAGTPATPKNAWPTTAAAKVSSPPAPAKNPRPSAKTNGGPSSRTDALRPAASNKVLSTPLIGAPASVLSPAGDYDGFSVGTVDDSKTSGYAARTMKSRAARPS